MRGWTFKKKQCMSPFLVLRVPPIYLVVELRKLLD